jgi:hypothetical protein
MVIVSVMLLFLPAVIELKKPKDLGPRRVKDKLGKIIIKPFKIAITNIDETEDMDNKLTETLTNFLCRFPNIEV